MLLDYHMHTFLSDGRDDHEKMVASAAFRGISEIGFSDHISIKPTSWALPIDRIDEMISRIHAVQSSDTKGIEVKFGVEMDYFFGMEKQIQKVIE
ncbi:MAG: PHP domain-containing protein [Bacteroidales bacterium]|nr:PHP domain-containing protein [Bacteroidales bacterium]